MADTAHRAAQQAPRDPRGTGSVTIADLMGLAASRFAERVAMRHKRAGHWRDVTYAEVGDAVREIGLGLIDLGVEPGERACILCTTRPEWTLCDFALTSAGAVVVPIYPTNSPEECLWVAGDSAAVAVLCEDAEQAAKISCVSDRLPHLRHIVVIDPDDGKLPSGLMTLNAVRERGRGQPREELDRRAAAVSPGDPFTIIYTSGTTGQPKGCVLTHANYRSVIDMCEAIDVLTGEDTTYLFLPLAHAFALLMPLLSYDLGGAIAFHGGDSTQIITELQEVRPHYLPSVPRIFEKVYSAALSSRSPEVQERMKAAAQLGVTVRDLLAAGRSVPPEALDAFHQADAEYFAPVRAIFGGRLRQAVSGAAPIAREILEFFYGCGVPVLEGYGMTETSTVATYSTIGDHRFGSVGRPIPGCELRVAEDGELLIRGPNVFAGYHNNADASFGAVVDGWLHTGDVGTIDQDGYLFITGRKKDIIITAGGKNITPSNIENDMKQVPWISQAVMHGDRRPYPVMLLTLDMEALLPWALGRQIDVSEAALASHPAVRQLIEGELDRVNRKYAPVEQVKKFAILDHDLSQQTGELTPTLKVKRNVINEKYASVFDALYRDAAAPPAAPSWPATKARDPC